MAGRFAPSLQRQDREAPLCSIANKKAFFLCDFGLPMSLFSLCEQIGRCKFPNQDTSLAEKRARNFLTVVNFQENNVVRFRGQTSWVLYFSPDDLTGTRPVIRPEQV
jgi:hypothetical protein